MRAAPPCPSRACGSRPDPQSPKERESVSHSVMSDSLRPHGLLPARLLCWWDFPGENTGVGCHFLLQGIFPNQGSNLGLLHGRQILLPTEPPGKPSLIIRKISIKAISSQFFGKALSNRHQWSLGGSQSLPWVAWEQNRRPPGQDLGPSQGLFLFLCWWHLAQA